MNLQKCTWLHTNDENNRKSHLYNTQYTNIKTFVQKAAIKAVSNQTKRLHKVRNGEEYVTCTQYVYYKCRY